MHAVAIDIFVERLKKQAKELGVDNKYIAAGYVFNEDLVELLKLAECFVFPSLSEGFGLPGLEAMAVGCPVVCSSIPVLKEVYGDAAAYFDPKDPKDVARGIESVVESSKLKQNLREKFREYDIILLMVSEVNLHCGFWNFADEAYEAYFPDHSDPFWYPYENQIRNEQEWFRYMVKKAKEKQTSLDNIIRSDAKYLYHTENR